MKKLKTILTAALAGFALVGFASCDNGNDKDKPDDNPGEITHEHSFKAIEIVAPTCNEKGYTFYKCSGCNETKKDNYKNALGHHGVVSCDTCGKELVSADFFKNVNESFFSADLYYTIKDASLIFMSSYDMIELTCDSLTIKVEDGCPIVYGSGYRHIYDAEDTSIEKSVKEVSLYMDESRLYTKTFNGTIYTYDMYELDRISMKIASKAIDAALAAYMLGSMAADKYGVPMDVVLDYVLAVTESSDDVSYELGMDIDLSEFVAKKTENGYSFTYDFDKISDRIIDSADYLFETSLSDAILAFAGVDIKEEIASSDEPLAYLAETTIGDLIGLGGDNLSADSIDMISAIVDEISYDRFGVPLATALCSAMGIPSLGAVYSKITELDADLTLANIIENAIGVELEELPIDIVPFIALYLDNITVGDALVNSINNVLMSSIGISIDVDDLRAMFAAYVEIAVDFIADKLSYVILTDNDGNIIYYERTVNLFIEDTGLGGSFVASAEGSIDDSIKTELEEYLVFDSEKAVETYHYVSHEYNDEEGKYYITFSYLGESYTEEVYEIWVDDNTSEPYISVNFNFYGDLGYSYIDFSLTKDAIR